MTHDAQVPAPAELAQHLLDIVKAYDVRGRVPEQWGELTARALGAGVAQVLAAGTSHLVVGHDMRPSSPSLVEAFAEGARSRGVDVTNIGLCSTDGLYFASGHLDLPGAMFTASHNPAAYNGIKLCRAGAQGVGRDTGLTEIRDTAVEILRAGGDVGEATGAYDERDMLTEYAEYLRSLVDLSGVRELHVVVDAGNGMGGLTVPAVLGTQCGLAELPLRITPMYFELDGTFPNHEANPLEPANLVDLQRAVVAHGADLGLAFDGDADRCFAVDERGEPLSPSAVTALVASREIAKERAAGRDAVVLHNAITSAIVPETIAAAGAKPVRTKVGHSHIKAEMAQHGAVFGGEHSAHYYFREFWGADTGMLAAMHLLAALGQGDAPVSELLAPYDPYSASGEINSTVADAAAATQRVRDALAAEQALGDVTEDDLDGVTFAAADGAWWCNVRPSNTEPLLRLNVEAREEPLMVAVRDAALAAIRDGESS